MHQCVDSSSARHSTSDTSNRVNGFGHVALLTGGTDKPYALGLASALSARGVAIEFVGSDELDCLQIHQIDGLRFLNLRGDQRESAPAVQKIVRVLAYYARLARYAARRRPRVLHILWNNRFELFDRTLVMLYYRALGKRIVLTAHNINIAKRDRRDSWINRLSLRCQYRLCHHVFVHTERMKDELLHDYGVRETAVTVVPFGINDTIPVTGLSQESAKRRLGLGTRDKTLLCFGQIAPYKGLEHVVVALSVLVRNDPSIHLVIAGKVKPGADEYWRQVEAAIEQLGLGDHVKRHIGFVPDSDVEPYFKAADAVVLPYLEVYQSGVPFLAFSFGTPVVAADVGCLADDVVDGVTGFLCRPADPTDLATTIERFFSSELYFTADFRREGIRQFACDRHSWATVAELTRGVYERLLDGTG